MYLTVFEINKSAYHGADQALTKVVGIWIIVFHIEDYLLREHRESMHS